MKKTNLTPVLAGALLILFTSCQQNETEIQVAEPAADSIQAEPAPEPTTTGYDSLAAQQYGADEYGMRKYVVAFLSKGTNHGLDSAAEAELQLAHLQNIGRMALEGQLALAGPFMGEGDIRGIYIFNVKTLAEAEELTKSDPAIQAGSLVMELREWYGTAALMAVGDIHKTLSQKSLLEM